MERPTCLDDAFPCKRGKSCVLGIASFRVRARVAHGVEVDRLVFSLEEQNIALCAFLICDTFGCPNLSAELLGAILPCSDDRLGPGWIGGKSKDVTGHDVSDVADQHARQMCQFPDALTRRCDSYVDMKDASDRQCPQLAFAHFPGIKSETIWNLCVVFGI